MTRAFKHRNFGVYIGDERGERHHLPHAHIKERKNIVWTINLYTLEPMQAGKKLPKALVARLQEEQEKMIEIWEGLNGERV
jgi:hypothetical protein